MKYQSKVVVIDAFKWTGGLDQIEDPEWIAEAIKDGRVTLREGPFMQIHTVNGIITAKPGDYIKKYDTGNFDVMIPQLFEACYVPIKEG